MEDDTLSDVIPSNLVSRQVRALDLNLLFMYLLMDASIGESGPRRDGV